MTDIPRLQPTTCFACGTENPHGLHVNFRSNESCQAEADFVPTVDHEGWPGVVHGGILATLLDEAMAYALWFNGHRAVTVRMDTRFRKSVSAGQAVLISAKVETVNHGLIDASSAIRLEDGSLIAEARARFMPADVSY